MVFPAFAAAEFIRLELHLQELEPSVVAFVRPTGKVSKKLVHLSGGPLPVGPV